MARLLWITESSGISGRSAPTPATPPGEYQYRVERERLDQVLPFPQGYHDLRLDPCTGADLGYEIDAREIFVRRWL